MAVDDITGITEFHSDKTEKTTASFYYRCQTVAQESAGEYYTVYPALCHHHMSTHCLPLGRRSL